ncbi:biofilm peroxide resistance protein BsmA [Cronobacter dublinensis]|uniref:Biofilm peroxide resistance protein BsmA n=1 Tax=Cronobacter dublinensis TaxID=413497 RepID=A0A9Q4XMX7_9ENTR|nr:biofilm peroxide resistance protein BsmA [Cronobacter dublinensis]NCH87207.1 biofilm peroxide resistance protein BsmA [Cronobacter dublinensis]
MPVRRLIPLFMVATLTACSALQGTPPVADHPQEIQRYQTQGLTKMGTVTTLQYGSPDDALRDIAAQAGAAGADYYQVVSNDDTLLPGRWHAQAILYRK